MNGSLRLCCMAITQSSCGTFDREGNRFSFFASHSSLNDLLGLSITFTCILGGMDPWITSTNDSITNNAGMT